MGLRGEGQGQAGGMVTAAGITHWALFLAHVRSLQRPKAAGREDQPGWVTAAPPGRGSGPLGLLPEAAGSASGQAGPHKGN